MVTSAVNFIRFCVCVRRFILTVYIKYLGIFGSEGLSVNFEGDR